MESVLAVVAGALGALVMTVGGGLLARRWGLPGLSRDVQDQQARLIGTLQGEVAELREQHVEDERRIASLEGCVDELRLLRAELTETQADLGRLYRATGRRPPTHKAGR